MDLNVKGLGTLRGSILALGLLGSLSATAQVNVTTQHNDIGRTGQNLSETTLNTGNVNATQFGRLFAQSVDGYVYAQPLYMSGVVIGGNSHNVVYVATEHDSVYAFDADSNSGANASPLWQASMLSTTHGAASGATTVPWAAGSDIVPEVGITGTPVIDPASGTLYVVSKSRENGAYVQRLHALDITTGLEKFGGPVTISASVPGNGQDNQSGVIRFNAQQENQRTGLLLLNGIVYVGWGSHEDMSPWHGWVIGYDAATLQQTGVFNTSPAGNASAVWMSGSGLAADVVDPVNHPYGRMFIATGNGDYTATKPYTNAMDYGDSHINLDLTNGVPTVTDEFTPRNQANYNATDGDVGSGGVMILPDQTGTTHPHLLVQAGKAGTIYLLNRDNMGGYNTTTDKALQELTNAVGSTGAFSSPAYWNGNVYYLGQFDYLKSFAVVSGALSTNPTKSTQTYGFPGATPSISANGTTQGIAWTIDSSAYSTPGPAVLRAHDASNVATMLYSSATNAARDAAGQAVKFAVPTVANGKVYVGTANQLDVYGLLSAQTQTSAPLISPAAGTFTGSVSVSLSDSTVGAVIYYTLDGSTPTTSSTLYSGAITITSTTTLNAVASASGLSLSTVSSATFTQNPAATPNFSLAAGTYATVQTVTISDSTAGNTIYYTTDGSTPTTSSTHYTGAITLATSTTLQAIAVAPGYAASGVQSVPYTISGSSSAIVADASGFASTSGFAPVGSAVLNGTSIELTNGGQNQVAAFWSGAPVNIQNFFTEFQFQQVQPASGVPGEGLTFTIQNSSAAAGAIGTGGRGLGYQGLTPSFAVKFDLRDSAGEGTDSTGFYTNGAVPTLPAVDMTGSGVTLLSGDVMDVQIGYNGTTLTMTITDTVTNGSFSMSTNVNLPTLLGASTAYVGFTGGTGASTLSQYILDWTYTVNSGIPAAFTPTFSPAGGTYASMQTVTISDATPGAAIHYTTDGSTPNSGSTTYTSPLAVSSTETIKAIAVAGGYVTSQTATAAYTINVTPQINFPTNFSSSSGLNLVGASVTANTLQLSDGGSGEARAAWFGTPVNVQSFTSDFNFSETSARADGFTFTIQNAGPNAVGAAGGGLGYAGMGSSVAIKFDLYNNVGEGPDSIGFYTNGATPGQPSLDIRSSGVNLHSADIMHAHVTYDGSRLALILTDTATNATVSWSANINIPSIVGANAAYVGFTAGTGGLSATQAILNWTYTAGVVVTPPAATPTFSPVAGAYSTPQSVTISDATAGASIYYTTDGTRPSTSSQLYTAPVAINSSQIVKAIAVAAGLGNSPVAIAPYTLGGVAPKQVNFGSGFSSSNGLNLIGATVAGSALTLTNGSPHQATAAWFTVPLFLANGFTTDFNFQDTSASADGFTFTIQGAGPTALGGGGGSLGYQGIGSSVAIKFDLYSNNGEGNDSTGFYTNGKLPTLPALDMTASGVNLHSGNVMHAHITYDGTTLGLTLTDTVTNATYSASQAINIPAIVGGGNAYVGFTAGTGGLSATQSILNWSLVTGP